MQKQGKLVEAEACYRRAIEIQPDNADSHYFLGNLLYEAQPAEAELCYRRAIQLRPDFAFAYTNLGSILRKQTRLPEAEACDRRAIELRPELAEPHNNLGKTLKQQGKLPEAEACYRRAIQLKPDLAEIHYNLGEALDEQGRGCEAEQCFRRAIELKTSLAEAHGKLAELLRRRGNILEAEGYYRQAIQQKPDYAAAIYGLANLLYGTGRLPEAAAGYERVIELKPSSASSYSNLGNILSSRGQVNEEELCYRRAIELNPNLAAAHCNLGNTLKRQGRLAEAKACYQRAIEIKPNFAEAYCNLGTLQQEQGQLAEAEACFRRSLSIMPDFAVAYSNLLFCLSHSAEMNAEKLFAEYRRFAQHFEEPLRQGRVKHANSQDPDRCLRIGFVSGDLRSHPVAVLIEPILSHLARNPMLSLHAFVNQGIEDQVSDRLRPQFQRWHRIMHLSDAALSEKIRDESIDILIDLSGHTANNRLLTFARKPAPVQAGWVGYMGTTGMEAMDYYFADRLLLPSGQFQSQFTEKLVYLPAAVSYLPSEDAPAVNALPALENDYVSFGSFNRVSKLNPGVIRLWAQLLHALPTARMILGNMRAQCEADMVADWFTREGIAYDRLFFQPACDVKTYLGLYHGVDLCLDSFPFTGFTTTLHAMWMGVPTLTLQGDTPQGMQSTAVLRHVGLEDFIARDETDFVEKGLRLTGDLQSLTLLRSTFRRRMERSILGQPERIAAGLNDALRTMWTQWCECA